MVAKQVFPYHRAFAQSPSGEIPGERFVWEVDEQDRPIVVTPVDRTHPGYWEKYGYPINVLPSGWDQYMRHPRSEQEQLPKDFYRKIFPSNTPTTRPRKDKNPNIGGLENLIKLMANK